MLAPLFRLLLSIAVLVAALPAHAFLGEGDRVGQWEVAEVETHPEFMRVWFDGPGGRTGVEVVEDSTAASDWNTGRHRLMPAPGEQPPGELLLAVMARLRDYDDHAGPALAGPQRHDVDDEQVVFPTRRQGHGLTPRQWLALIAFLGLLAGTAPWWWSRAREPLARVDSAIERVAWPLLAVILVAVGSQSLTALDLPFLADANTQRIFFSTLDLPSIARMEYADMRHPPLYYLVLHVALWFGHGEVVVRTPAALFGLATLAALFGLTRPVLGAWRSLLVAGLLALNVPFLEHSREVADVTLFTFLLLASTALLLAYLREPEKRWLLVPLVLTETAMFYAYYMAPLAAVAQLVALASTGKRGRWAWAAVGAVAALCIPLVAKMQSLLRADTEMRTLSGLFPDNLWGDLGSTQILGQWASLVAPDQLTAGLLAVMVVAGVFRLGVSKPLGVWALALVTVSTGLMAWAVLVVRLKAYYMLFLLPALLILAVVGATGHPDEPDPADRPMGPAGMGLSAAALPLLLVASFTHYLWAAPRVRHPIEDRTVYRQMGDLIRRTEGAPSAVVADPNALHTILLYYLFDDPLALYPLCELPEDGSGTHCFRGEDQLYTLTAAPQMSEGWEERAVERLRDIRAEQPVWFVYTVHFPNTPLAEYLQGECTRIQMWSHDSIQLWRCGRAPRDMAH